MPDADITISDEDTPNPNAWKFTADLVINPGPTRAFYNADAAQGDALARALFAIKHVAGVMVVNDFVTVNKLPAGRWATLRPKVVAVLREHLASTGDAGDPAGGGDA